MSDSTGNPDKACCWLADLIDTAYPASAGTTLAAVQAMAGEQTFSRAQVAYLLQVAFSAGALARTAADAAELVAARAARFEPRPTREARIGARLAAMAEQDEILQLRTQGYIREPWAGVPADAPPGAAEAAALQRYMWLDDQ